MVAQLCSVIVCAFDDESSQYPAVERCISGIASSTSLYLYISAVQVGDVICVVDTENCGQGWEWDGKTLTLGENYNGAPLEALHDLHLCAYGEVTVCGQDGPAIKAGGSVYISASDDGQHITAIGDSGFPAVQATETVRVNGMAPFTAIGGEGAAALDCSAFEDNYYNSGQHYSFEKEIFAGTSESDATLVESWTDEAYLDVRAPVLSVIFDPNGGELASGESTHTITKTFWHHGMTSDEIPQVSREGHALIGWCKQQNGQWSSSYFKDTDSLKCPNDEYYYAYKNELTWYAIWQKIPESDYVWLDCNELTSLGSSYGYLPRAMVELQDGELAMPSIAPFWAKTATVPKQTLVNGATPDYFWSGRTYAFTSGETLYAGIPGNKYDGGRHYVAYGNGQTTDTGDDRVMPFVSWTSQGDLVTYTTVAEISEAYFADDSTVALDFNTNPDGSGIASYYMEDDVYLQWTSASVGSVIARSVIDDLTWDGRYGAVYSQEKFDIHNANGLPARLGYEFLGWTDDAGASAGGKEKIDPLEELPVPDARGRYTVYPLYRPYIITVVDEDRVKEYEATKEFKAWSEYSTSNVFRGWLDEDGNWVQPGRYYATKDITITSQFYEVSNLTTDYAFIYSASNNGPVCELVREDGNADGFITLKLPLIGAEQLWKYENGLYDGGATITIPSGTKIRPLNIADRIPNGQLFYGNGGTFAIGDGAAPSSAAVFYTKSSYTTMMVFPDERKFETTPEGSGFRGWIRSADFAGNEKVYKGGETYDTEQVNGPFYAVWDYADTAYVILKDGDNQTSIRATIGGEVTLPAPSKLGYRFLGWSDGSTTWAGGSKYSVASASASLTAEWEERTMLEIDGVEYDPSLKYDNGVPFEGAHNDPASGWIWADHNLTLYDYHGGAIYLPYAEGVVSHVAFFGENEIIGTDGEVALSCPSYLSLGEVGTDRDVSYSLQIVGGKGCPGISSYNFQLYTGSTASVKILGGNSAPAVHTTLSFYAGGKNVTMIGGGVPAFASEERHAFYLDISSVHWFYGSSKVDAEELTKNSYYSDINAEYLHTEPHYYTLLLDSGEGKLHGRSLNSFAVAKGERFLLENQGKPFRFGYIFDGWSTTKDGSGDYYDELIWPNENTVLYAQWRAKPAKKTITLRVDSYYGTFADGSTEKVIGLPESGTITPETPIITRNGMTACGWFSSDENGQYHGYPVGLPLDVSFFKDGTILRAEAGKTGTHRLFISYNGHAEDGSNYIWWDYYYDSAEAPLYSIQSSFGYILDCYNTKPDGSGMEYNVGGTYTFGDEETTAVLYAQWKEPYIYTTHTDNENLYIFTNDNRDIFQPKGRNWMSNPYWQTDDGRLYFALDRCDFPAGTRLTAVDYGGGYAGVRLDGNGADQRRKSIASTDGDYEMREIYLKLPVNRFSREGYTLIGWNSQADGGGSFYPLDYRAKVGELVYDDEDGWYHWVYDDALLAMLPSVFYAQWEKNPAAEIDIPGDMLELAQVNDDVRIFVAIYYTDGKLWDIVCVDAAEPVLRIDSPPGDQMTYQVFCLDGASVPMCNSERGRLRD